jgi:hypothetical protein
MRGVNDRKFLNLWQMIHRATCPGLDHARWQVDEVEWCKERHSFTGSAYSFTHEVHLLRRDARGAASWRLAVVSEYWWDEHHDIVKSTTWARMLDGEAKSAIAWIAAQEKHHRVESAERQD